MLRRIITSLIVVYCDRDLVVPNVSLRQRTKIVYATEIHDEADCELFCTHKYDSYGSVLPIRIHLSLHHKIMAVIMWSM